MPIDLQTIDTGAARLRVAVAGEGPLIVLVHGFPESWYSWRHQIPVLVEAGFRIAAPDVRGYGGSDRPHAIDAYAMKQMRDDIAGLMEGAGHWLQQERPGEVNAALLEFLGKLDR
jgi:epoxide hydrolase A/B